MTVTRVTSDPVPAVVGMATMGRPGFIDPPWEAQVGDRAAVDREDGDGLGAVDGAAATERHDDVVFALPGHLHAGLDRGLRRLRHGIGEGVRR